MSEKIVLIDGHSILNRAFYGLPDLTNSEGLHTNAVYGFLNILFRTLEEEQPQYLAVAFDVHAPTFRHQMYADYKGTRKPMPSELREQVPMLKEVLSAQTGYPSYYCDDYTDRMELIYKEWEKIQVHFDGIYTGFMAGGHQIRKVLDFLDAFYKKDTFLVVDPVMGDNGNRYPIFTPELVAEMKSLVSRADIITPNLTELCLLTGTDYEMIKVMTEEKHLVTAAEQMAGNLMAEGTKEVLVTGIRFSDKESGQEMMGNLAVTKEGTSFSAAPFIGESFSGTGDLVASVVAAGKVRGDSLAESMELAGKMIERAITDSVRNKVPRNDGVDYEQYLWMLGEKNRDKYGRQTF